MRNYLTLVMGLVIVSSPALASRARLESLGENPNGSLYINDINNVLYNPSFVNDFKKKLMLEMGGNTTNSTPDGVSTSAAGGTPGTQQSRPMAIYTNTFGDFAYGIVLNHIDPRIPGTIALNSINGGFLAPDNSVRLIFGGEAGVKWGASVFFAGNRQEPSGGAPTVQTANYLSAAIGVSNSDFQAFVSSSIIGKSKGSANGGGADGAVDEINGKLAIDAGGAYNLNENLSVIARFQTQSVEQKAAGVKTQTTTNQTIRGGIGYKKDVTKSVNLFSRLELAYATAGADVVGGTNGNVSKAYNVPLTLGAEAQALSWLAIRGSIAQSILGQTQTTTLFESFQNTTQVAAGIGLTFGDVQIDGLVATNGGANNQTPGFGGSSANAGNNFGFGDNMLTRVAVTYNF